MAKDSYGNVVPRKTLVRRVVEIYRYYLNSNGDVEMDKKDFKAELHDIKHMYGWDLDARIQIMRIHAAVVSTKKLRFRPCKYTNPKAEEAHIHRRVSRATDPQKA